jgi:signal transduction histidine kinase
LGLPISLKIIREQHLGRLEVESKEGIGTTFFIKLPLERKMLPTEAN